MFRLAGKMMRSGLLPRCTAHFSLPGRFPWTGKTGTEMHVFTFLIHSNNFFFFYGPLERIWIRFWNYWSIIDRRADAVEIFFLVRWGIQSVVLILLRVKWREMKWFFRLKQVLVTRFNSFRVNGVSFFQWNVLYTIFWKLKKRPADANQSTWRESVH